jgi:hypothetical protein
MRVRLLLALLAALPASAAPRPGEPLPAITVSDDYARVRARQRVPRLWWHATLFDANHRLAGLLGLQHDRTPYALAIDGEGRVLAVVHAQVRDRSAARIWRALATPRARSDSPR